MHPVDAPRVPGVYYLVGAGRELRARHGGRGIVTREMFVQWITDEVERVLG